MIAKKLNLIEVMEQNVKNISQQGEKKKGRTRKQGRNIKRFKKKKNRGGGGAKMAEEQDGETTFSPTNSSKEHLNAEQTSQNNF